MRAQFKIDKPDDMTATLTVNMTVGEWKALRNSLKTDYAGLQFGHLIGDIVTAAEAHFDRTPDNKAG
jgi:hypothetical protein